MTKKLSTNHKTIIIIASYNINNLTNHLTILLLYFKIQKMNQFLKRKTSYSFSQRKT